MRTVVVIGYILVGAGFVDRAFTHHGPWSWLMAVIAAFFFVIAYGTARRKPWGGLKP